RSPARAPAAAAAAWAEPAVSSSSPADSPSRAAREAGTAAWRRRICGSAATITGPTVGMERAVSFQGRRARAALPAPSSAHRLFLVAVVARRQVHVGDDVVFDLVQLVVELIVPLAVRGFPQLEALLLVVQGVTGRVHRHPKGRV